jgi:hypothetical protein
MEIEKNTKCYKILQIFQKKQKTNISKKLIAYLEFLGNSYLSNLFIL